MEPRYDPDQSPDPKHWLAGDEEEKLHRVQQYHRKKRIRLPNARVHAVIHVVVENQVALGDELPVKATLLRLMREGLSRYNAVHAVGTVLAHHLFDLLKNQPKDINLPASYYRDLEQLTAEGWLNSVHEEHQEDDATH